MCLSKFTVWRISIVFISIWSKCHRATLIILFDIFLFLILCLAFQISYTGIRPDRTKQQHYYNEISVSIATGILLCALQSAGLNSLVLSENILPIYISDLLIYVSIFVFVFNISFFVTFKNIRCNKKNLGNDAIKLWSSHSNIIESSTKWEVACFVASWLCGQWMYCTGSPPKITWRHYDHLLNAKMEMRKSNKKKCLLTNTQNILGSMIFIWILLVISYKKAQPSKMN